MKKTSSSDLEELFIKLGVCKGRIVMLHGFIPSLGIIDGGYDTLFKVLFDLVGVNGGVIVPTFTYSFTKNEVFDVKNSKSVVGDFTNHFLTYKNCYRNLEPNFSMAGIGKGVKEILKRDRILTFGKNSLYEKIEESDILFLLLGIHWDQGLSYFMHLEASFGINYRYNKVFHGHIIDSHGNKIEDEATHFVRDLDLNPVQNRAKLGSYLESNGIAKTAKFKYGLHKSIGSKILKEKVFEKLNDEIYYLLKEVKGQEV